MSEIRFWKTLQELRKIASETNHPSELLSTAVNLKRPITSIQARNLIIQDAFRARLIHQLHRVSNPLRDRTKTLKFIYDQLTNAPLDKQEDWRVAFDSALKQQLNDKSRFALSGRETCQEQMFSFSSSPEHRGGKEDSSELIDEDEVVGDDRTLWDFIKAKCSDPFGIKAASAPLVQEMKQANKQLTEVKRNIFIRGVQRIWASLTRVAGWIASTFASIYQSVINALSTPEWEVALALFIGVAVVLLFTIAPDAVDIMIQTILISALGGAVLIFAKRWIELFKHILCKAKAFITSKVSDGEETTTEESATSGPAAILAILVSALTISDPTNLTQVATVIGKAFYLARGIDLAGNALQGVFSLMPVCVQQVYMDFLGSGDDDKETDYFLAVNALMLTDPSTIFSNPTICSRTINFITKVNKALLEDSYNEKATSKHLKFRAKLVDSLTKHGKELVGALDANLRVAPVGVYMYGAPGIGKSVALVHLATAVLRGSDVLLPGAEPTIGHYCPGSKFADNYMQQDAYLYDDLFTTRAKDTTEATVEELIKFINNIPATVTKAAVDDKGMQFTSTFVGATSNQAYEICPNSVTDQGAWYRRLSGIKCNLVKAYAIQNIHGDWVVDKDRIRAGSWDHLRFSRVDHKGRAIPGYSSMTMGDAIKYYKQVLMDHVASYHALVESSHQTVEHHEDADLERNVEVCGSVYKLPSSRATKPKVKSRFDGASHRPGKKDPAPPEPKYFQPPNQFKNAPSSGHPSGLAEHAPKVGVNKPKKVHDDDDWHPPRRTEEVKTKYTCSQVEPFQKEEEVWVPCAADNAYFKKLRRLFWSAVKRDDYHGFKSFLHAIREGDDPETVFPYLWRTKSNIPTGYYSILDVMVSQLPNVKPGGCPNILHYCLHQMKYFRYATIRDALVFCQDVQGRTSVCTLKLQEAYHAMAERCFPEEHKPWDDVPSVAPPQSSDHSTSDGHITDITDELHTADDGTGVGDLGEKKKAEETNVEQMKRSKSNRNHSQNRASSWFKCNKRDPTPPSSDEDARSSNKAKVKPFKCLDASPFPSPFSGDDSCSDASEISSETVAHHRSKIRRARDKLSNFLSDRRACLVHLSEGCTSGYRGTFLKVIGGIAVALTVFGVGKCALKWVRNVHGEYIEEQAGAMRYQKTRSKKLQRQGQVRRHAKQYGGHSNYKEWNEAGMIDPGPQAGDWAITEDATTSKSILRKIKGNMVTVKTTRGVVNGTFVQGNVLLTNTHVFKGCTEGDTYSLQTTRGLITGRFDPLCLFILYEGDVGTDKCLYVVAGTGGWPKITQFFVTDEDQANLNYCKSAFLLGHDKAYNVGSATKNMRTSMSANAVAIGTWRYDAVAQGDCGRLLISPQSVSSYYIIGMHSLNVTHNATGAQEGASVFVTREELEEVIQTHLVNLEIATLQGLPNLGIDDTEQPSAKIAPNGYPSVGAITTLHSSLAASHNKVPSIIYSADTDLMSTARSKYELPSLGDEKESIFVKVKKRLERRPLSHFSSPVDPKQIGDYILSRCISVNRRLGIPAQRLSLREAVEGGGRYADWGLKGVDLATGAGVVESAANPGKGKRCVLQKGQPSVFCNDEARETFERAMAHVEEWLELPPHTLSISLKPEALVKGKMPRVLACEQWEILIIWKIMFGAFTTFAYSSTEELPWKCGMNVWSVEWCKMALRHLKMGNLHSDSDSIGFEQARSLWCVTVETTVVNGWYSAFGVDQDRDNLIRAKMIRSSLFGFLSVGKWVYFKGGGNSTGSFLTMVWNELDNWSFEIAAWAMLTERKLGRPAILGNYHKDVELSLVGDDNVSTMSDRASFMTFPAKQAVLKECGLAITTANKDDSCPDFISFEDIQFMGCGFAKSTDSVLSHTEYIPWISDKSLQKPLLYTTKSMDPISAITVNLRSVLFMLAFSGKQRFNAFLKQVHEAFRVVGDIYPELPDFYDYQRLILSDAYLKTPDFMIEQDDNAPVQCYSLAVRKKATELDIDRVVVRRSNETLHQHFPFLDFAELVEEQMEASVEGIMPVPVTADQAAPMEQIAAPGRQVHPLPTDEQRDVLTLCKRAVPIPGFLSERVSDTLFNNRGFVSYFAKLYRAWSGPVIYYSVGAPAAGASYLPEPNEEVIANIEAQGGPYNWAISTGHGFSPFEVTNNSSRLIAVKVPFRTNRRFLLVPQEDDHKGPEYNTGIVGFNGDEGLRFFRTADNFAFGLLYKVPRMQVTSAIWPKASGVPFNLPVEIFITSDPQGIIMLFESDQFSAFSSITLGSAFPSLVNPTAFTRILEVTILTSDLSDYQLRQLNYEIADGQDRIYSLPPASRSINIGDYCLVSAVPAVEVSVPLTAPSIGDASVFPPVPASKVLIGGRTLEIADSWGIAGTGFSDPGIQKLIDWPAGVRPLISPAPVLLPINIKTELRVTGRDPDGVEWDYGVFDNYRGRAFGSSLVFVDDASVAEQSECPRRQDPLPFIDSSIVTEQMEGPGAGISAPSLGLSEAKTFSSEGTGESEWSVQEVAAKPNFVTNLRWTTSDPRYRLKSAFSVPYDFLVSNSNAFPFQRYLYATFDFVELVVSINATKFQSGCLILTWVPLTGVEEATRTHGARPVSMTTTQHMFIRAGKVADYTMKIPWVYPRQALSIHNKNAVTPFGTLLVSVWSPLMTSPEGQNFASVSFSYKLQGAKFTILNTDTSSFTPSDARSINRQLPEQPVLSSSVSWQRGRTRALPMIDDSKARMQGGTMSRFVDGAVDFAAGEAKGAAAGLLGVRDQPNTAIAVPTVPRGCDSLATGVGDTFARVLDMKNDDKYSYPVPGEASELSFQGLTGRPTFFKRIVLDVASLEGTLLMEIPLVPNPETLSAGIGDVVAPTLASYVAQFATFWKADINFNFKVWGSPFHNVKIAVLAHYGSFSPSGEIEEEYGRYYRVFSITPESMEFSVNIEFKSDLPRYRVPHGFVENLSDVAFGLLTVRQYTQLMAPEDAVSPTVDMDVFMSLSNVEFTGFNTGIPDTTLLME
eukprot:423585_1